MDDARRTCAVRICATADERAQAFALRRSVFVVEQGVAAALETDADDAGALHFLALQADGTAVGAARLVLRADGTAKLGRVAVRRDARGGGVGQALMAAAHAAARAAGVRTVVLHAQSAVVGFYAALGYRSVGDGFQEAGIAHQRMELALD